MWGREEARQNNALALFCIGVKAILVAETRDVGFWPFV
jgi:hypothetical protein